jgi:signal transduction histidine kinase/ActR/RegA family two-component response regulator
MQSGAKGPWSGGRAEYAVLAGSLLVTAIAALQLWMAGEAREHSRFEERLDEARQHIERRLDGCLRLLEVAAGVAASALLLSPDGSSLSTQLRALAESIDLEREGLLGIGLSPVIRRGGREELGGLPEIETEKGLKIWPEEYLEENCPITFLEPQTPRNLAAMGFDMSTDPRRREAMDRARDSGLPAATGAVGCLPGLDLETEACLLVYLPLYRAAPPPDTVDERRASLAAFLFVWAAAGELLGGERLIAYSVHDGHDPASARLLHGRAGVEGLEKGAATALRIDFAGRSLAVVFANPRGLRQPLGALAPLMASCGLLGLLAFVFTRAMVKARRRVERISEELERCELAGEIQEARGCDGEAESLHRIRDEFLARLSHELRTPLTAIVGWAHLLRCGALESAEMQQGLETIERNAKLQVQLIEDLLDMSRITSGKLRLELQLVDLPLLVDSALAAARPALQEKRLRLERHLDAVTGPVEADPNRLRQVLANLLSNAVKFTPAGGTVTVRMRCLDPKVEICVSDTGCGIDPRFLASVFDGFRQEDRPIPRTTGGLGLGLAIAKHLVELHGGTLRAQSAGEGLGATFSLTLPLAPKDESPTPRKRPGAAVHLDGVRVLVVEDDPDTRELLRRLLVSSKAVVETASSSAEALALLERMTPDVLVSDIGLPGEDGYALMRKLRARETEKGGAIPALALTALARQEDRRRALLAGFQLHLVKPIEPAELTAAIASLAGGNGREVS